MKNETFFFGICDTGMFSLTVLLCDDGDEDSWQRVLNVEDGNSECLNEAQPDKSPVNGVLFPQSDSPICRVVWYKNKNNKQKIDL